MAISINTNSSASNSAYNVNTAQARVDKSTNRLSSGDRIVNPANDAGGLAVSMKLGASLSRLSAVSLNLENSISFVQTQVGSIKTLGSVLERMSELVTLMGDVTKQQTDLENYNTEFQLLKGEIQKIGQEKFNGISLFSSDPAGAEALEVNLAEDGSQTMDLTLPQLLNETGFVALFNFTDTTTDVLNYGIDSLKYLIQGASQMLAACGATESRLRFALDSVSSQLVNLEAAKSRISDVDVAQESVELTKSQVLLNSASASLRQANSSSDIVLKLINS